MNKGKHFKKLNSNLFRKKCDTLFIIFFMILKHNLT